MEEIILVLEPKFRKKAHQANGILHANAAIVILDAAYERITNPEHSVSLFAVFEVISGLLYLIFLVRSLLQKHHHTPKISWLELLAACIFLIEGIHKMHAGANYIHYAYFFLSVLYLALGLFYGKFLSARKITLTPAYITAQLWPWQKKKFLWENIKLISIDKNKIYLTNNDSQVHILNLNSFLNPEKAEISILDYFKKIK